jgi:hypothetical protein
MSRAMEEKPKPDSRETALELVEDASCVPAAKEEEDDPADGAPASAPWDVATRGRERINAATLRSESASVAPAVEAAPESEAAEDRVVAALVFALSAAADAGCEKELEEAEVWPIENVHEEAVVEEAPAAGTA